MHTNGKPGLFFFTPVCFFLPQFWAVWYFSDLYTDHISRTKNKHLLLLCIIVVTTKSLPKSLHCERGMTNPPLWQWLGRPSSYFLGQQFRILVDVRTTCPCAMLYTFTSRLHVVRPKISYEIDHNKKANTRTQQYQVCRCSSRSRYPRLYPWPLKSAGAQGQHTRLDRSTGASTLT